MTRRVAAHRRRRQTRCVTAPRVRRGSSLIEIMLACMLMTVAILGLLGTSKKIAESVGGSRQQMIAASVAQARLDSLQSLSCTALSSIATGTRTTSGIGESWTITSATNTRVIVLTLTIPRLSKTVTYRTIVPCV